MKVQIGQLRCFLAVADHRHFTRAARDLGLAALGERQGPRPEATSPRDFTARGQRDAHTGRGGMSLRARIPRGTPRPPKSRIGGIARGRLAIGATRPGPRRASSARAFTARPGIELRCARQGRWTVSAVEEGTVEIAPSSFGTSRRPRRRRYWRRARRRRVTAAPRRNAERCGDDCATRRREFREGYDLSYAPRRLPRRGIRADAR